MTPTGIPEPIRRFLADHIRSIEQLEVLVLLHATPEKEWSAAEVNQELRSSVSSIQNRLDALAASGLIAREAGSARGYRYAPPSEDVQRLVDGLASAYKQRRLAVINLIYAQPESDAVSFSEAFKLSRKRGDE